MGGGGENIEYCGGGGRARFRILNIGGGGGAGRGGKLFDSCKLIGAPTPPISAK